MRAGRCCGDTACPAEGGHLGERPGSRSPAAPQTQTGLPGLPQTHWASPRPGVRRDQRLSGSGSRQPLRLPPAGVIPSLAGARRPSGSDPGCRRCGAESSRSARAGRRAGFPRPMTLEQTGAGPEPGGELDRSPGTLATVPGLGVSVPGARVIPQRPTRLCLGASPERRARARRRLQPCGTSRGSGLRPHALPRKIGNSVSTKTDMEGWLLQPNALAYTRLRHPGPEAHLAPNYTGTIGASMCPPRREGWGLRGAFPARARGLRTAPIFLVMAGKMGGDSGLSGTQCLGGLLCSQIGARGPCCRSGPERSTAPGFRLH